MTTAVDMGGIDLTVNSISAGAATPGASGTNIAGAELTVLHGVTAGTVTASKAVVVDASKNIATFGTLGSGAITVTSAAAGALSVGRQGATAPALKVDASTASSATGISITAAAAAGGVAVAAISSGTDESLTLDAKGAGTITINGTATGGITLSRAVTASSTYSGVGGMTILNATAIPAAGTAGAGYKFSSTSNFGIFFGSGAPTLAAAKGSLYLCSDGSSSSTRLFVNSSGSTTWVAVTTAS